MLNKKWLEEFFLTLIETGFENFPKDYMYKTLWTALGRPLDRQRFTFALTRIKYYFRIRGGDYTVKWELIKDDFPELKPKIEPYLKKKEVKK